MNARYARQYQLPEIGIEGQKRLLQTKVLCVGAGGLGSSALQYLAASGIGLIGVCDADTVELSNLQRQILYKEVDQGKIKSTAAILRLAQLNSEINFIDIPEFITKDNVFAHVESYDYILDATDNLITKLLLNDACHFLQKPLISACVQQFQGQYGVFGYPNTPCWRCLYPDINEAFLPNCTESGVLGMIPGLFGTLQALEVVKLCLGLPQTLVGKLYFWDLLVGGIPRIVQLALNPDCPICTHGQSFAMLWGPQLLRGEEMPSHQISVQELQALLSQNKDIFLLDVRNPDEYQSFNLGGYLLPLAELAHRVDELPQTKPIIIYCRSGHRSQVALELLKSIGFNDIFNLTGGVLAWQNSCQSS